MSVHLARDHRLTLLRAGQQTRIPPPPAVARPAPCAMELDVQRCLQQFRPIPTCTAATLVGHRREIHGTTDHERPLGETADEAAGGVLPSRLNAVRGPIADDLSGLPPAFELEMAGLMRRLPDAAVEPHDEADRRRIEPAPTGRGAFDHDHYYESLHIAHNIGPHLSM